MTRLIKIGSTAALMVLLGGCSTLSDIRSPNHPKRVLYHNWNDRQAEKFRSGDYRLRYDKLIEEKQYKEASLERNRQLDAFLTGIDVYFQRQKNLLITGKSLSDTGFDIVQLGLTGTAAFTGGSTPNVLAAIATAVHGTRVSVDKNLFNDHATLMIVAKMEQLRAAKRVEIEMQKADVDGTWSLDAAMRAAIEYYYAGTMNGALLAIFNETGKQQETADAQIKKLIEDNYNARKNAETLVNAPAPAPATDSGP